MTSLELVSRAQGTGLVAALTFDDGPNGSTTTRLLDFLAEQNIRAVFCVIGANVRATDGAVLLRRMVDEGHELCNHSTSFSDMGDWATGVIEADLRENLAIIRDALGDPQAPVPYFRAPNGNWGITSSVAAKLGMRSLAVMGTIDDWNAQEPEILANNLRAAMHPGELVVAHDGGGDREGTVDAIIRVVTERLAQGWRFTLPDRNE